MLSEPEFLLGARSFPTTQGLLAGSTGRDTGIRSVGWHGTSIEEHEGAFAVVTADFEDLVGEVVRVRSGRRSVFVYVVGVRAVPTDISLARRAFLGLSRLSVERLRGRAAVTL